MTWGSVDLDDSVHRVCGIRLVAQCVIAKPKAACGLCFHQLGGHVLLSWLMREYDVAHKTGKT